MDERASIGTRLRELRTATGKSCEQVAREIGRQQGKKISREMLDKCERDQRIPNGELVVALASYYETTTDYLLGYSPIKNAVEQLEITAFTLGLSLEATQRLVDVIWRDTSGNNSLLETLLNSPILDQSLSAIREVRGGIARRLRRLQQEKEQLPAQYLAQHLDFADMYLMRALKTAEPLLREAIEYDAFKEEVRRHGID